MSQRTCKSFATSHVEQGASDLQQELLLQELVLALFGINSAQQKRNCPVSMTGYSDMLRVLQVIKFWLQHLHRFAGSLPATVIQVWAKFVGCASSLLQEVYRRYVLTWQLELEHTDNLPFSVSAWLSFSNCQAARPAGEANLGALSVANC